MKNPGSVKGPITFEEELPSGRPSATFESDAADICKPGPGTAYTCTLDFPHSVNLFADVHVPDGYPVPKKDLADPAAPEKCKFVNTVTITGPLGAPDNALDADDSSSATDKIRGARS